MPKAHVDQSPTAANAINGDPLAVDPESGRVVEPELIEHTEPEGEPETGAVAGDDPDGGDGSAAGDNPDGGETPSDEPELFDPNGHTVSEVNAYLDSLDQETEEGIAEFDRVLDAEKAGQNRKGIVG